MAAELGGYQERKEEAQTCVRTAIAALEGVPAVSLDADKHETIQEATDDLEGLERALTHEVDQLREGGDRSA